MGVSLIGIFFIVVMLFFIIRFIYKNILVILIILVLGFKWLGRIIFSKRKNL